MDKDFIQMVCMCKNTCTILRLNKLSDSVQGLDIHKYWIQTYPSYKLSSKYLWLELSESDMLVVLRCLQQGICANIRLNKRNIWLSIIYDPVVHTFSIQLRRKKKCMWEVVIDQKESIEVKNKLNTWLRPVSPYPDYN